MKLCHARLLSSCKFSEFINQYQEKDLIDTLSEFCFWEQCLSKCLISNLVILLGISVQICPSREKCTKFVPELDYLGRSILLESTTFATR